MSNKTIRLKDNRRNNPTKETLSINQFDSLAKIAEASWKDSAGIIRYPQNAISRNKDDFIKLSPKSHSEYKLGEVRASKIVDIYTSNTVGVLKCNDVTVEVQSRFDDDDKQNFFSTILSHAFECDFLEDYMPNMGNNSIWEIMLLFVFSDSLEKAYQQGLFKQYVENNYNDFSFKSQLDVPRHLKLNIPFQGRIAWSNREYSYDNPIIRLIHHSINTVSSRNYDLWTGISGNSSELPEIERVIREAIPTYSQNSHYHLLQECQKPITHPLFSEYEPLRKICLMILREEGIEVYDTDEDEVYGILFDCAWLWESFVYKRLLSKISLNNQMKFVQPGMKAIFKGRNSPHYKPDFITKPAIKGIVLDAKYKAGYEEKDSIDGDNHDIYQATTYQFINNCILTGLLFPVKEQEKKENRKRYYNNNHESIDRQFWYIPFWVGDTSKENYHSDFEKRCNDWVECYTNQFEQVLSKHK